MKNQILISTIIVLQLAAPALADDGLGQSEWLSPQSSDSSSNQFAAGGQLSQSELITPGSVCPIETPITSQTEAAPAGSPDPLEQSILEPERTGSVGASPGQLGQSQWVQEQSAPASGQGQSPLMQPGSTSSSDSSGQLGQSAFIQPGQTSSQLKGSVTRRVRANGTGLANLAQSVGQALQVPLAMAASSSLMGFAYRGPAFYSFGSPFYPVYGFPVSRGSAIAGTASYMAGAAINQMLRQLH